MANISLNPKNTYIGSVVLRARKFDSAVGKSFSFLIWLLGLGSIAAIFVDLFYTSITEIAGLSYLGLAVFILYLSVRVHLQYAKEAVAIPLKVVKVNLASVQGENLFSCFSYKLAEKTFDLLMQKGEESEENELAASILDSDESRFILIRLGIPTDELALQFKNSTDSPAISNLITAALDVAISKSHTKIEISDIMDILFRRNLIFKKIFNSYRLEISDLENVMHWYERVITSIKSENNFSKRFKMTGGIGRDWAFGYTTFLRQFSVDVEESIKEYGLPGPMIGRESEIRQIEQVFLRQGGSNAILVGDAGVGKKTTIFGFAKKIIDGEVNRRIAHDHILQIDTESLLSGVENSGEMIERLQRVFLEAAYAGNVIVFIENIDNLLSAGSIGREDISAVLLPMLDRGDIHVIGTASVAGYNDFILSDPALSERFVKISIKEPDDEELMLILEETLPDLEYETKSIVTYEALGEIMAAADRYILTEPNPEKSINLLRGVAIKASAERGETIILPKDVEDYLEEKLEIPTGEIDADEKEKLLNLESEMHKSIIGQDEGIKALADALRRARTGVTTGKKPIGSFLFIGPTGVGKTATAKALAKIYFGGEDKMIRFDMSEYQNSSDVYRLIGTKGEPEQGELTTYVREQPFSLILLDEIEKANAEILNLLLSVLDEGYITDGNGQKVSFINTVIIATSNAGAQFIRESIKSGTDYAKIKALLVDHLIKDGSFRPEFINRFSGVIAFSPLTVEQTEQIAKQIIDRVNENIWKSRGVKFTVDNKALLMLAKIGFDPQMGARPMERVIAEKIENFLADKILREEIKEGDTVLITEDMLS